MEKKSAVLFGATGLTGSQVFQKLINDDRYDKITVLTRSNLQISSDKAEIIITPFENLENYKDKIKANDLFCCLGTTIKKAGSKENFRKADLEFPAKIAEIASKNGIQNFIMISSIGADPNSSNFYLRTKGEAEMAVQQFDFNKTIILRPSMLLGKRGEFRFAEEVGKIFMFIIRIFLRGRLRKFRAIEAERVAKAMIKFANITTSKSVFESHEIELFTRSR